MLIFPRRYSVNLPSEARDIYREAFNRAFAAHSGDLRQEEVPHRTAWIAVKRAYVKVGDSWIRKAAAEEQNHEQALH
jgi:cation transport regulator